MGWKHFLLLYMAERTLQRTSLLKCTPSFSFCYSFYWESRFLFAFQFCLCFCCVFKESVRQKKQHLSAHKCVGVPAQGMSLADLFREKGELTTKCSADNLFNCSCGHKCGQIHSIQELLITCQRALAESSAIAALVVWGSVSKGNEKSNIQKAFKRESRAVAESHLWCISSGSGVNLLKETPILGAVRDHAINTILQLEF